MLITENSRKKILCSITEWYVIMTIVTVVLSAGSNIKPHTGVLPVAKILYKRQ